MNKCAQNSTVNENVIAFLPYRTRIRYLSHNGRAVRTRPLFRKGTYGRTLNFVRIYVRRKNNPAKFHPDPDLKRRRRILRLFSKRSTQQKDPV